MSDWVTEYLGLKPKRNSEPSAPARTDLSRVVPTLEPVSTSRPPAPGSRSTLSSDLENLSIGLGRGLTSQLEGVKALVTQPREVLEGMAQFAGEVIDDPRVLAEMAKEYGIKATSGPLGFGEVVGEMVSPLPKTKVPTAEIRKAPGGNWLPGSVEKFIDNLRSELSTMGDRPADRVPKIEEFIQNNPTGPGADRARLELYRQRANVPVDKWLETKLANYIKNDMATERDPVRLGIEQRVSKADEAYARGKERIAKNERKIAEAKARGEDTATIENRLALEMADLEQKYQLDRRAAEAAPVPHWSLRTNVDNQRLREGAPVLAKSAESANWEDTTDFLVEKDRAALFQDEKEWPVGLSGPMPDWIKKVSPNTPIYSIFRGDPGPFAHMRDELVNSLRENTDLPPELRLKPEDLDKMGMDAVAAHVGKVDAWRERNRAAADLLKSRNAATVTFKEYPGAGLEWKELKMPTEFETPQIETRARSATQGEYRYPGQEDWLPADWDPRVGLDFEGTARRETAERLLQEALEYEGQVMGHCVGGYCPQVAKGKTQIFSLRDAKGEPHVTIEVRPGRVASAMAKLPDEERIALLEETKADLFGDPSVLTTTLPAADQDKFYDRIDQVYLEKYGPPPAHIVQIKGKGNKKPADRYIPFVQDFVKSGKWSQIGDYENAGLVSLEADNMMIKALKRTGNPLPMYDPSIGVNGRYIMTPEQRVQLSEWFDKGSKAGFSPPKFADGGRVEEEEYDEDAIEEIVESLRRRFEQVAGVARAVPRKIKQTAADVTDIGEIISRSKKIPLEYFDPKSEVAGEADAMRHLLFQAQLAQKYGDMPAQMVSYLHEYTSPGQPSAEREMDFLNDALGRELAREAGSEEELIRLARKYIESGKAKTLPKEQRGGY